ncbi:MAG: hypothetical protein OIF35_07925, partial [Cellvibrionaceae bacterium]|nr:hypothetical protein [Cellvibrionaceae bacterium]
MNTPDTLNQLQRRQLIWRASRPAATATPCSSGHATLDKALGGGLPSQGLFLIDSQAGVGELRWLQHYLCARLQQGPAQRQLAWVNPPWGPSGEALAGLGLPLAQQFTVSERSWEESLWAAEQCLHSGACALVLLWEGTQKGTQEGTQASPRRPQKLNTAIAKRLKLAAAAGAATAIVFRPPQAQANSLGAHLAMAINPEPQGLSLHIYKRPGGWPIGQLSLNLEQQWPDLCHRPLPKSHNILPFGLKPQG